MITGDWLISCFTTINLPGVPVKLGFTTQPAGAIANTSFTTQPVVAVQDGNGNTITNSSASITLTITTGTGTDGAVLGGTAVINAANGVATFSGLSINLAGNGYTLTATSGQLTPSTSNAFDVTNAIIYGGGGGGGGGSSMGKLSLSGFSSKVPLDIDSKGFVQAATKLSTQDGQVALDIANKTRMLSSFTNALSILTVESAVSAAAPPAGNALVMAFTFGPDGATFDPALTLTMTYNPSKLPKDVAEKDLYIAYYDGTQWQTLEGIVDARVKTVSAKITHFSNYGLMGKIAVPTSTPPSTPKPTAPATVTQPPTPAVQPPATMPPTQALAVTPTSTPEKPPAQPFNWTIVIIIVVALIVILALVLIVLRRRNPRMES